MIIYIDSDYKCHAEPDEGLTAVEDAFFDGKCDTFINGFRFVPSGKKWTREDGAVFHGEMIAPWEPWEELDAAQREYERELLVQYEESLSEIEEALGVNA